MNRRPPRSTRTDTLFPYTTLVRSIPGRDAVAPQLVEHRAVAFRDKRSGNTGEQLVALGRELRHRRAACRQAVVGRGEEPEGTVRILVELGVHRDMMFALARRADHHRAEERRVGKDCGSTCRYRGSAYH